MKNVFFDSWEWAGRTLIITMLAYAVLIVMLRVSGKRTLSKMNAFDFVVTVALGFILTTVVLTKSVALLDGTLAFFLLTLLLYCITWLSVRRKGMKQLSTSDSTLPVCKGKVLHRALRRERVPLGGLYMATRKNGLADLNMSHAIVLETTGTMSVLSEPPRDKSQTLSDVRKTLTHLALGWHFPSSTLLHKVLR